MTPDADGSVSPYVIDRGCGCGPAVRRRCAFAWTIRRPLEPKAPHLNGGELLLERALPCKEMGLAGLPFVPRTDFPAGAFVRSAFARPDILLPLGELLTQLASIRHAPPPYDHPDVATLSSVARCMTLRASAARRQESGEPLSRLQETSQSRHRG